MKLGLKAKFVIIITLELLVILFGIAFSMRIQLNNRLTAESRELMNSLVSDNMKGRVEQAITIYKRAEESGKKRDAALQEVADLHWESNYVWVHTMDPGQADKPTMAMHPTVPDLNGKPLDNYLDLNPEKIDAILYKGEQVKLGSEEISNLVPVNLFVDMNKVCSEKGEGTVVYYWPKPSGIKRVGYPKLSYVKQMKGTNLVFGSGVYIDDLDEKMQEISAVEKEMNGREKLNLLFVLVVSGTITLFALIVIVGKITKPVARLRVLMKQAADGDLTQTLDISSKDEIGELASSYNNLITHLRKVVSELVSATNLLTESSSSGMNIANELSNRAVSMAESATGVSAAGEQLSANTNTMASGAEELSTTIGTIAAAVEEMSATLNEVARNCDTESQRAEEANSKAEFSRQQVDILKKSANEVTSVISLINDIADQTNLLALNATIEAASAGEAGKGFAVVANEVKELAKQSAQATEKISELINNMVSSTGQAATGISDIAELISEMSQASTSIAAAVEEQTATVNEISRNIADTSRAGDEIAANIHASAQGAEDVSKNIINVKSLIDQTTERAGVTKEQARELSALSQKLEKLSSYFKM